MWIGIFLVVFGAIMLLEHMGIIRGGFWGYLWPVLIVAIGLSMILRHKKTNG